MGVNEMFCGCWMLVFLVVMSLVLYFVVLRKCWLSFYCEMDFGWVRWWWFLGENFR